MGLIDGSSVEYGEEGEEEKDDGEEGADGQKRQKQEWLFKAPTIRKKREIEKFNSIFAKFS